MVIPWFQLFFEAFGLLFLAELGDKTQLIILTLASKGKSSRKLALGAASGFAIIVLLGGAIALLLNNVLDISWITLISGFIFIIIAIVQLYPLIKEEISSMDKTNGLKSEKLDSKEEKDHQNEKVGGEIGDKREIVENEILSVEKRSIEKTSNEKFNEKLKSDFMIGLFAIMSMELGDKTQIMTIVLAASSTAPVATLMGSWVALTLLAVIGAYAGNWVSKKVPKKTMDWIASFLFLVIGIIIVAANF